METQGGGEGAAGGGKGGKGGGKDGEVEGKWDWGSEIAVSVTRSTESELGSMVMTSSEKLT